MYYIDSHCHLADPRLAESVDSIIRSAQEQNITAFLQGGVGPEDWQRQIDLRERFPEQILLCFGLHPYWVAEHDDDLCDFALDQLAPALNMVTAIGEMGLDFRPNIMKNSRERQISAFEAQLELARFVNKPVVLHLVQAHDEAMKILDLFRLPERKGMVHAFNGGFQKAQDFIQRGLLLSIGASVLKEGNNKLHDSVRKMPLEYLLLETDSPDQPPPEHVLPYNTPLTLWQIAKKVGQLRQIEADEVMKISRSNFKRLFGQ